MRIAVRLLPSVIVVSLATSRSHAEILWLEAEQFDKRGGWTNDAQFIDQMGSPYLMAIGLASPVEDASTTVRVPKAGRYRLWVRTKDWMPRYHPGKFQVLLDGRPADRTFGASGDKDWLWEDGGIQQLDGHVELRLHDLTGYYGRCDAVVLADDLDWVPPDGVDTIAELRETGGGVSRQIETMAEADVVVVGGGLAGSTAAVAAARNGCRTVLIQNRPVLGGNASSEILVPPVGAWPGIYRTRYPLDPRETGIVDEYRTAGNQKVKEGRLYSNRLLRLVRLEPNLSLHLNTHATGVQMHKDNGRRIAAVDAVDVQTGRRMRFPGRMFVDCTGDSAIGVAAGAEFRHGKEPKSMYNEPWAPEAPSKNTMGNGLKYFARDMGEPRPFKAPDWIFPFPTCDGIGPGRHPRLTTSMEIQGQWNIELGGLRDTYADAEEIRDDLLRLIYGLWDHTRNQCAKDKERAANYQLVWVGHVAGKRENRRLMGDYVLTQNDVAQQTLFADRVAFGAWSVDDHYSAGFFHKGPTGRHFDGDDHHYKGVPFTIPFRSLYSKNVENLLMAGRNISASHLGMSNTRVMLTCAILGHAAGTGAAFCVQENTSPRGVYQDHMMALQQQLLKEGAAVPGLKADDPRDLASRAAATASSERTHTSGERMAATNVVNGFARAVGERMKETTNAWGPDPKAAAPHWVQLTWPAPVTFNVVHVSFQTVDMAPGRFAVEAQADGNFRPIAEIDLNRHRRHVLGFDPVTTSAIRVVLDEPAAICEIRVYEEPLRIVETARRAHHNMRLPDQGPFLPWGDEHEPDPSIDPKGLSGVVIDDAELQTTGLWQQSTWSGRFLGQGYLTDGNTAKGKKSLRCRPLLPDSGRYEIRLAYSAFKNRASNTPITVQTSSGETTVRLDQRKGPAVDGLFTSLGIFDLDRNTAEIVISNDGTDGYVVVDGVQFTRK
ncbi:MAG: FAD-dependent oxidoreductase [Planctomycetota bacterium]|jgi:hypothetical protein